MSPLGPLILAVALIVVTTGSIMLWRDFYGEVPELAYAFGFCAALVFARAERKLEDWARDVVRKINQEDERREGK